MNTTVFTLTALFLFSSSAFAAGGSLMAALHGVKPKASISKGKCDIKIDCAKYQITINGENAGQIICASDTGASFKGKKITLATSIQPAAGAILPEGFPMIPTSPMLCKNCFIHVYPWVGPKSSSRGCVGITTKAWNEITKCGGSEIEFITLGGVKSAKPAPVNDEESTTDVAAKPGPAPKAAIATVNPPASGAGVREQTGTAGGLD